MSTILDGMQPLGKMHQYSQTWLARGGEIIQKESAVVALVTSRLLWLPTECMEDANLSAQVNGFILGFYLSSFA